MLGPILKSEITNKKHKNLENVTLSNREKDIVYTVRVEARRQNVALCHPGWECVHQVIQKFHRSPCLQMIMKGL